MVLLTVDSTRDPQADPVGRAAVDFAELALDLHSQPTSERTIERVVEYAVSALGADDAGIMVLHGPGRSSTPAMTSESVRQAHDLQVELGEGPCLDALKDDGKYLVAETATETRWPTWCARVAELGYHSVVSVRLATRERRYGSLNLYASRTRAFDRDDLAVAAIFARHASVAMASSQDADGLQRAIDARKLIGIAMGMLMERYGVDSDRAFDVLRRYSQHHNVKLREVARQVVEQRELPDV